MATTQLIVGRGSSTTTARYFTPYSGVSIPNSESDAAGIVSSPGIIKNLRIKLLTAPGAGGSGKQQDITLYVNGVASLLTVNIFETATTGTDTTHNISVSTGDTISLEIKPTNSPATSAALWVMDFNPTTDGETLFLAAGYKNNSAAMFFSIESYGGSTAETNYQTIIPCSGVIKYLYAKVSSAIGAGKDYTFTVRKNSVDQTVTTTVSGAVQTTGNDTSHSFSVAAGDLISITISGNNAEVFRYVNLGLCFLPDLTGNFPLIARPTNASPSTSGARYGGLTGLGDWYTDENNAKNLITICTIKNVYIALTVAPGGGKQYAFVLRKNAVSSALTTTISDANTTGNAATDVSIADGDFLDTLCTPTGTPATTRAYISYTGYIAPSVTTRQKTIYSDTKIKVEDKIETIDSNTVISKRNQKTIDSNTKIKATQQKTINANTKIKTEGNQENIVSDTRVTHATLKYIYSDSKIKVTNKQEDILSDTKIISRNQKTIESDSKIKVLNKTNTILSDTYITTPYFSKFIHDTFLFLVTDTTPVQIIKVSILNPTIYYKYIITGKLNGKDLVINNDKEYLYISLNNGYVVRANLSNPTIQEVFYIGENQQLYSITHNAEYLITFIADGRDHQSLFVLDESETSTINTDFRTIAEETKTINTYFTDYYGKIINTDFRTLLTVDTQIKTDLRFLKEDYNRIPLSPLARTDFHVKIDGTELTNNDLILNSIRITHTADNKSTAEFTVTRKHDDINNPTTITNNNIVEIYIQDKLEFSGKISSLQCDSQGEKITIGAETDTIISTYNITTVDLPLTILNEKIHLYDTLIDDVTIENPYILPDDENPKYYKGIKVNLGTKIQQRISLWIMCGGTGIAQQLEDGTFDFMPNYTYFWEVQINYWDIINGGHRPSGTEYIGTSLSAISTDTYEITWAYPLFWQRILDDIETELGYYYIGVAPFKEISVKNGQKIIRNKYVDKEDGLYIDRDASYDYISYCQQVAAIEYEKLKNINGNILPKTTTNIHMTIDAYLYYKLQLLTRLNLVNTTAVNIYKNNNGFPISIKQITIESDTMTISISSDNTFSQYELDLIDKTYPEEPQEISESSWKIRNKFDLATFDIIEE